MTARVGREGAWAARASRAARRVLVRGPVLLLVLLCNGAGGLVEPQAVQAAASRDEASSRRGARAEGAELVAKPPTVWERLRRGMVAPPVTTQVAPPVDAEDRTSPNGISELGRKVERTPLLERDVLALACGHLDDDRGLDLALVSRRSVTLGTLDGSRFTAKASRAFRELSPIAPAPLREPLAGAVLLAKAPGRPAFLDVGLSDRAHGVRLDAKLQPVLSLGGLPFVVAHGDVCLGLRGAPRGALLGPCAAGDAPWSPALPLPPGLDALAAVEILGKDPSVHAAQAYHDPKRNEVVVRWNKNRAVVPHAGAQLALGDLDGDGEIELVSTLDVLVAPPFPLASAGPSPAAGVEDAVVVRSLGASGELRLRARVAVPGGVKALALCPPDGPGPAALVFATPTELGVIR